MNINKLKDSLNHEDEIIFISKYLGLMKEHINKWYIFDKPIYNKNTIFYSIFLDKFAHYFYQFLL